MSYTHYYRCPECGEDFDSEEREGEPISLDGDIDMHGAYVVGSDFTWEYAAEPCEVCQ